jgi:hypothetical protein
MKEVLASIGIEHLDSYAYEYAPVSLNWWNPEYKTCIRVEIFSDEEEWTEITMIFYADMDGILKRMDSEEIVFNTNFKNEQLKEDAFIEQKTFEQFVENHSFKFSPIDEGYITTSFESAKKGLASILNVIINKTPINTYKIGDIEISDEEIPYKIGDHLNHFIAMMHANGLSYTKEEVLNFLELGIELEGIEYVEELKPEAAVEFPNNFQREYEVNPDTLEMIKETIRNFTPKVS